MPANSSDRVGHEHNPRREEIFCPVLGALVKTGELRPDGDGRVGIAAVARSIGRAGVSVPFRLFLAGTSPLANTASRIFENTVHRSFDIFELRGGLVASRGDSGILNQGSFDESAFERFVSHSTDGRSMTIADLARASAANGARDGRRDAPLRARANLATLAIALGSVAADGTRMVPIEALRDLYRDQKMIRPLPGQQRVGFLGLIRILREMSRTSRAT